MTEQLAFDFVARDKSARAFDGLRRNITSISNAFSNLAKKISGKDGLGGLIAGYFSFQMAKGIAQTADRINDLSNRLQIGAEVLSSYRLVSSEVGTETENIAKSLQQLGKNAVNAAKTTGESRDAFNRLNIDASKFKELSLDQQFQVLAEAMKGVENPSERINIAMALMGKSGAEMLQVLDLGGDGLRQMQQEAERLGVTLTQTQAQDIGGMMDAIGRLGLAFQGLGQSLMAYVAPVIETLADLLTDSLLFAINGVKTAFDALTYAFRQGLALMINGFGHLLSVVAEGKMLLGKLPGEMGEGFRKNGEEMQRQAEALKNYTADTSDLFTNLKKQNAELTKTADLFDKVKGSLPGAKDKDALREFNKELAEAKRIYEQTRTPVETYMQQIERLRYLHKKGLLDADTYARAQIQAWNDLSQAMNQANRQMNEITEDVKRGAQEMQESFIDAVFGINGGFADLKRTALDTLKQIGASMAKNIILGPRGTPMPSPTVGQVDLGNAMPWLHGGGIMGALTGSLGNFFGGFFAEGGSFGGGKPIVVGEKGPEIIMPRTGGTVVPNEALGRPVQVNVTIQTPDAASFRKSQGQIAATMADAMRRASRNL